MYLSISEKEKLNVVYEGMEYFTITPEGYQFLSEPQNRQFDDCIQNNPAPVLVNNF